MSESRLVRKNCNLFFAVGGPPHSTPSTRPKAGAASSTPATRYGSERFEDRTSVILRGWLRQSGILAISLTGMHLECVHSLTSVVEVYRCRLRLLKPAIAMWISSRRRSSHPGSLKAIRKHARGAATTLIWSCTEGKFSWSYYVDEIIVILEGSIVLESEGMPPKRYGVGDVVFFPNGAHAKWHVEGHVKKLAFLHQTNPLGLG